jgi:hypothetical protein
VHIFVEVEESTRSHYIEECEERFEQSYLLSLVKTTGRGRTKSQTAEEFLLCRNGERFVLFSVEFSDEGPMTPFTARQKRCRELLELVPDEDGYSIVLDVVRRVPFQILQQLAQILLGNEEPESA